MVVTTIETSCCLIKGTTSVYVVIKGISLVGQETIHYSWGGDLFMYLFLVSLWEQLFLSFNMIDGFDLKNWIFIAYYLLR